MPPTTKGLTTAVQVFELTEVVDVAALDAVDEEYTFVVKVDRLEEPRLEVPLKVTTMEMESALATEL